MARTKEFDREEVLTKAMNNFWRYGCEATSMQTLVKSMGIDRGSLYDTFGDKRSLFERAIAYYKRTVIKEMIASLKGADAGKQTIIDLFRNLVVKTVADRESYGCFLTNKDFKNYFFNKIKKRSRSTNPLKAISLKLKAISYLNRQILLTRK